MKRRGIQEILEGGYGRVLRYLSPDRYRQYAKRRTASRYDMCREPSEDYYAGIYLHFIREDLSRRFGARPLKILDVGCGQGRLSIPLARDGHTLTGIDISDDAIGMARAYASMEQVRVEWIPDDLSSLKVQLPDTLFDCIICTELLYMVEDPEAFIKELLGWLQEGGLLLLSLRTRFYYLLTSIKRGDWDMASLVARGFSGTMDGLLFHWHTKASIGDMLSHLGLQPIRYRGIGILSGIPGDPLGSICMPSPLDPEERKALMDIELLLAEDYAENGRYLYVAAKVASQPGA
ncbi:MAG: methyltransferase domain-containing protein [Methanomicrobiales archaeon]|jgi:ubiquinone/menaquinone biosynthesis C-methylase UbiE